ncbi:anti-sigma factor family protein [Actinophytocola algeriensis]|uniref:Anti-sigma factor RsiW n=1 Tax=Actinophytocola algeriensis TaxID=1768010 RepID=A0A7W7QEI5_9PSEU|nr:zf-HC2 domain-containing protein [Actinophytocola algeriensis]MBB4911993.1 anti-sigma factor RsiW [Actinophytocola algeriensis]MBE1477515.1 anti-sigma factor RsiW [Actinophytocola algeriensis]
MTDERGWGLSEQHLLPDAVVAFVDGELSALAYDRASSHLARCASCAAEITAQRQAASAVQSANAFSAPAGLLANLMAIPDQVEMPSVPDGLAMTKDGQLVAVQRPDRVPQLGGTAPLGSSAKLGEGRTVLGRRSGRRAAQGAGVVVSGLVLGALALVTTSSSGDEPPRAPANGERPAVIGGGAMQQAGYAATLHVTNR